MSKTVPIAAAAIVVTLAGVVYTTLPESATPSPADASFTEAALPPKGTAQSSTAVEFSVELPTERDSNGTEAVAETGAEVGAEPSASAGDNTLISEAIDFARSIAQGVMTETLLSDHVSALQASPAMLSAVLDEFSIETDPTRLDRLRLILGQLDDPALVPAAEAMIFSGNPLSAGAGLDLLRDIGATVPEARNVALDVLSSTQDPEMLVGATNIVVVANSDDPEITQRVVSSLSSLVQHPDASVRRASYSTLARWSNDPSITPTLLQGLTDEDSNVRKSTAYGFVGYANADSAVIEALLSTAQNASDTRRTRKGAVLALRGMPLDESQQVRLESAQQQLK